MAFDVDAALKAGYSRSEIADYLASQKNFDAGAARKAGYSDSEILSHLAASDPVKKTEAPAKTETAAPAPAPAEAPIDYDAAATGMQGSETAPPTEGLIARIGKTLRPEPRSVMDNYKPTPQEQQAEIDRRLSYGAGPISPQTVAAADVVRSTRGTQDAVQPQSSQVERVVQAMDERGERTSADMFAVARDPEIQRQARLARADDFRTPGEWAIDTVSAISQGATLLVQLPVNIIAPGSELGQYLRDVQKEWAAQESGVLQGQREQLRERVMNEDGFFGKYAATVQELVTNPALGLSEAIKQVPMFLGVTAGAKLGGMTFGGAVNAAGRVSPTLALGEAISGGAIRAGAQAVGTTAGGVTASAIMAGGDAAGSTYERLVDPKQTPLEVWKQNPDYQRLIADGKSSDDAIKEIATAKARLAAMITAPLGVFGFMGAEASIASRGLIGSAAQVASPKTAAKTFGKEIVGEQIEEGGTQLGSNVATRTIDPSQRLMEGVPEAMGTALVTSAPFAAVGAANELRGPAQPPVNPYIDQAARTLLAPDTYDPRMVSPEFTVDPAKIREDVSRATSVDDAIAAAEVAAGTINVNLPPAPPPLATPLSAPLVDSSLVTGTAPLPAAPLPATGINPLIEQQFGFDQLRLQPVTDTTTSPAPAPAPMNAPRPQRIQGTPVEQLTDEQLEEIAGNESIPAITRRGASVELTARRSGATMEGNRVEPTLNLQSLPAVPAAEVGPDGRVRIEPTFDGGFVSIPADQTLRDLPASPVGGPVAAQRARAAAQQSVDAWAATTGRQAPVLFNPAPAQLDAAVNEIAQAVNSQFAGRIYAFSDTRPEAVNGIAIGSVAFVNTANVDVNIARTSLHEFHHTVEQIAKAETAQGLTNTPAQQYVASMDSVFDDMTEAGKRAYIESFLHKDELAAIADPAQREARIQELLNAQNTRSEMTADFLGNRATDKKFWQDVAQADPEGFRGFVQKWLGIIDNLLAQLRGTKTQGRKESARVDKYVRDLNRAKMVAREALVAYSKATRNQGVAQTQQTDTTAAPQMSAVQRGGVAEDVGEFKVRTQKDGTLGVAGDVETIRALLPEDVKGRPVPGGLVFTTSDAPRVRAALEGRKLAYSRSGQVIDRLPVKNGKYVGAPGKYNTPAKIAGLRKSLRKLALEGERGRYWYENSSREVLAMVGGNVQEARKFVALLAIYSPQAKVDANSTFALRAWAQYKAGLPISVKTAVMDNKAQAALDNVDAFWSGEKTGNFFFNLLREIDPTTAGKQGATIDMWMMRAGEYGNDAPTATQYAFMENETNRLAQELGWEPQQVQAAIWVAMKARMENSGVKKRTEASSEKKGWIRFDYPIKNGRPVKTRVILNAQAHRDNWLKHAFAHTPTKEDTAQAKFDFSDGLRRHIGQLSWEARPGRSTNVLPGVNDAPYAQQVEFQQAVQKALLDDNGVDLLAYKLGLLVDGPDILAPGIWQGEVAAGMQKLVALAPAKGTDGKSNIDPAQKKAVEIYAAMLGLLLRQEGVGYHRPFYKGTKAAENAVNLGLGRTLTAEEAQSLWGAIDERMRAAGVPNWEDAAGLISSPTGIRVVNFGALKDNGQFRALVKEAAETLAVDEIELQSFSTDGDLVFNDWKESPNGEGYRSRIREAYGPGLLNWARDVLAPRVQSVFNEFSSRYGWGEPGQVESLFDQRQDQEVTPQGAQGAQLSRRQRGINVRNDGDNRYADLIVDGDKTMESRDSDSLRPYVGQTVGIIRTGEGPAKLIGSVKVGEPIEVNRQQFRELESEHLVPKGSAFDIKPGGTKFLYPLTDAKRFDEERDVESRGIVARDVQFSQRQRNDAGAALEALDLVRKARAYEPQEGEARVVFPILYHSGTGDANLLADGVEPQFGSWVAEVLADATDEEIDAEESFVPLSYYAGSPAWIRMQTARKLGKSLGEVTLEDVRKSGQLAIVYNVDDRYGDAINEVYQIGPDGYNGGYTEVTDVYGRKRKLYETGLEDEGDYRSQPKTLFGVEPGDIITKDSITPDIVLTGDALVEFMRTYRTEIEPGFQFSQRQRTPLGFYSALADGVANIKTNTAPAAGWKDAIKGLVNKGAVKADEVEWSGVNDWLDLQQGKVTREALAQYLKQGGVQVEETVLGGEGTRALSDPAIAEQRRTLDAAGIAPDTDPQNPDTLGFVILADGDIVSAEELETFIGDPEYPEITQEVADAAMAVADYYFAPRNTENARPKYHQYQLPGGENYREVLLTLPKKEDQNLQWKKTEDGFSATANGMEVWVHAVGNGNWVAGLEGSEYVRAGSADEAKAQIQRRLIQELGGETAGQNATFTGNYRSRHWDQPNVIAHIRMNDRTDADGNKVLFIEEIQSDWGQEGKKKGFRTEEKQKVLEDLSREQLIEILQFNDPNGSYTDEAAEVEGLDPLTKADALELIKNQMAEAGDSYNVEQFLRSGAKVDGVPTAPFVTKTEGWLNLALKRIMVMGAEGGYDKVAFVTGEQSADRYDLSKQVDEVQFNKNPDGTFSYQVRLKNSDSDALDATNVPLSKVEETFGKEIAVKMNEATATDVSGAQDQEGMYPNSISGDGLKVGGEGMKTFYDSIVPLAVKKLLPKVGGEQVGVVKFATGEKKPLPRKSEIVAVLKKYGQGDLSNDEVRDELGVNVTDLELEEVNLSDPYDRGYGMRVIRELADEIIKRNAAQKRMQQPGFDVTSAMREKVAEGLPQFSPRQRQGSGILFGRDEVGRFNFAPGAKAYDITANVANKVLLKMAMKPASEELSRAMRNMKVEVEKVQNRIAMTAEELARIPQAEREMISDVIEGELKANVYPPQHVLQVAASMQSIMSEQSRELVRLGMLSQDAADRWDQKYLPRFYESKLGDEVTAWAKAAKALLGRQATMQGIRGSSLKARGMFETIDIADLQAWEAQGWEQRDPNFDPATSTQTVVWRDYTRQERENMGEIRDAMFRFVMGYNRTQRDIALGRLYESLSQNYASRGPKDGYVLVPDTKVEGTMAPRYGKLAGKYVPKEIMDHLSVNDEAMMEGLYKIYRAGLSKWKEGKTVLNPVSHANNVISNITMAHFAGVSYWDVQKYAGAVKDMVTRDAMVQEAKDVGLFGGTFNQAEIVASMPPQLRAMAGMSESKLGKIGEGMWDLLAYTVSWNGKKYGARPVMQWAYEGEDLFFRYLVYRDARKRGMNPEDAREYSQQFLFTYDDLPKGARRVRDYGIPFFAYAYKVVPVLTRTALEYPWRYAAPAGLAYAANTMMYAIAASLGGDEDDWWGKVMYRYVTDKPFRDRVKELEKGERENLPPWMKGGSAALGTPKAIRLGTDDLTGLPLFLDISRIFPGGDLLDMNNNTGGIAVPQPLMLGNPLLTTYIAMFVNLDTFFNKNIVNPKTDTGADKAQKRGAWLWDQVTPAIAVGNYHFDRLMNVIANMTEKPITLDAGPLGVFDWTGTGRDRLPVQPKYAAMQTMGIKVRPYDLDSAAKYTENDKRRILSNLEQQINKLDQLEKRGAMSTEARDIERDKLREKKRRVEEGLTIEGEPQP